MVKQRSQQKWSMKFDKCSIRLNDKSSMYYAQWSTPTFSIVYDVEKQWHWQNDGSPYYWPETLEINRICGGASCKIRLQRKSERLETRSLKGWLMQEKQRLPGICVKPWRSMDLTGKSSTQHYLKLYKKKTSSTQQHYSTI